MTVSGDIDNNSRRRNLTKLNKVRETLRHKYRYMMELWKGNMRRRRNRLILETLR